MNDALVLGVCEAARKHGIPQPTISGWRRAEKANGARAATDGVASERPPEPTTEKAPAGSGDRESGTSDTSEQIAKATKRGTKQMRPARRYTPSEKATVVEYAAEHGVNAAKEKFGASRFAIHEWRRKIAKAAKGEGPSPSEIEAQRDREVLAEWHKHAGLGPSQVRNQLRRRGIKVGVATVRRVMEDAGYRPPKVKRDPHDRRYESVRPNHRWHLDLPRRRAVSAVVSG